MKIKFKTNKMSENKHFFLEKIWGYMISICDYQVETNYGKTTLVYGLPSIGYLSERVKYTSVYQS